MNTTNTLREKLLELFNRADTAKVCNTKGFTEEALRLFRQEQLALLDRILTEVVGVDEILHIFSSRTQKHYFENLDMVVRNKLRAELRTHLADIRKEVSDDH